MNKNLLTAAGAGALIADRGADEGEFYCFVVSDFSDAEHQRVLAKIADIERAEARRARPVPERPLAPVVAMPVHRAARAPRRRASAAAQTSTSGDADGDGEPPAELQPFIEALADLIIADLKVNP